MRVLSNSAPRLLLVGLLQVIQRLLIKFDKFAAIRHVCVFCILKLLEPRGDRLDGNAVGVDFRRLIRFAPAGFLTACELF